MSLQMYNDITGKSAIIGYDDEQEDSITIYFKGGQSYTYSYENAGEDNVEEMKQLAKLGEGLNSFIYNNCRFDYD